MKLGPLQQDIICDECDAIVRAGQVHECKEYRVVCDQTGEQMIKSYSPSEAAAKFVWDSAHLDWWANNNETIRVEVTDPEGKIHLLSVDVLKEINVSVWNRR